jgi:hypothetical protein
LLTFDAVIQRGLKPQRLLNKGRYRRVDGIAKWSAMAFLKLLPHLGEAELFGEIQW